MDWVLGKKIGQGSFATVSLAVTKRQNSHQLIAVKSCRFSHSSSLINEKLILEDLENCPEIIQCYGEGVSYENGEKMYNVLLEYASCGDLSAKVKHSVGKKLTESEIKKYTKSLLKGLNYIHKFGYVHCDIKLQNILLGDNGEVKIADFGLAKKIGTKELRGTPLYMSPEMVAGGDQGPAADIWALGCAVAEMVSGERRWKCSGDLAELFMKIVFGEESLESLSELSEEGRDFVGKCFLKDPNERWTAEMLLNHPFVCGHDDQDFDVGLKESGFSNSSPKCPFDFPDWVSSVSCSRSITSSPLMGCLVESTSPVERLRVMVSDQCPDWSVSDDWITVRGWNGMSIKIFDSVLFL